MKEPVHKCSSDRNDYKIKRLKNTNNVTQLALRKIFFKLNLFVQRTFHFFITSTIESTKKTAQNQSIAF
jgi:hypothetical protein